MVLTLSWLLLRAVVVAVVGSAAGTESLPHILIRHRRFVGYGGIAACVQGAKPPPFTVSRSSGRLPRPPCRCSLGGRLTVAGDSEMKNPAHKGWPWMPVESG